MTVTITNGASNTVTVTDLLPGTYTVHEVTGTNGTSLVGENANDIEVKVDAEDITNIELAEFTNNKDIVGGLQIKKNVTVNSGNTPAGTLLDGDYTFIIKQNDTAINSGKVNGVALVNGEVTVTITNGASNTVTVTYLMPGT